MATNEVLGLFSYSTSKKSSETDEYRNFWACDFRRNNYYYQVNARLLTIGDHCYIYMEEECIFELGEESVTSKAAAVCEEFDITIYPRIIDLAGHPNGTMGDIDNDPKIFILFHDGSNYYSEANDIEHNISNKCEMVYINYRLLNHHWVYPTIAHEFHHLIWFNNDWGEPPFTLEALAQYATYHAGYLGPYHNLVPQVASYLPHPENSPLYWNNDEDYGSTYLFAFYIAEKYGVQILRDLIDEPSDGPQGIEAVLQSAGYNITFNELFMNWITALTIDELGFQNNLFGFEGCDPRISCNGIQNKIPINQSISLGHYAFYIQKLISPPDNLTVTITRSPTHAIGVSMAFHDAFGWHVQQSLHYEDSNTIKNSFSGSSVKAAYLIMSYISKETPIAPNQRGSDCPFVDIKITITEGLHDNEMPHNQDTEPGTSHSTPFSDICSPLHYLCVLVLFLYLPVFKKRKI